MIATKHVMRYLKGTIDFGIYYDRDQDYRLYGYTDSYWDESVANIKVTSGGCYCMGSTMISWFIKKQSSVPLNMAKTKYIEACSASCESIWI